MFFYCSFIRGLPMSDDLRSPQAAAVPQPTAKPCRLRRVRRNPRDDEQEFGARAPSPE